ncbi:hypothetical protein ANANG_G00209060 [Anguilla anguilla]|uniref:CCHC FOG-type domain-containing protein n=1 Tax=Anguilla anguilla TaxID=7936 RepID=A0A9D3RR75_ANGAN|nr:hypothetical protein ANANG_G00209060 [Anguilla anguilla]
MAACGQGTDGPIRLERPSGRLIGRRTADFDPQEEGEEEKERERARGREMPRPPDLGLRCRGPEGPRPKGPGPDATWGPYSGRSLSAPQREGQEEEVAGLTLTGTDTELWLKRLPVTSNHSEANCTIYSQGEELYCKVTKAVQAGDSLLAGLPEPTPTETHNAPVKEEEPEPPHPEIHLLPQQAGMAAILATAIINKDVFPCKACGIWYRSERNLQAHLQFYCASRKHASALETPARTRSGERPFLCLICLSAFSSKPSCERHLQRGASWPPPPPLLLSAGLGEDCGVVLKCQVCGFPADTLALLQQHVQTHLKVMSPAPRQSPSSSASPDSAPGGRPQVKAEPASATPGSSPEPQGGAAPPPQASEILAKMTEMVHARLRQSHTPTTPVGPAPARPVHKGGDVLRVRHHLQQRQQLLRPQAAVLLRPAPARDTPAATPTAARHRVSAEGAGGAVPSRPRARPLPGARPPRRLGREARGGEGRGAGLREASGSEGESGGRASEASEGSQSPGGSGEDAGDPTPPSAGPATSASAAARTTPCTSASTAPGAARPRQPAGPRCNGGFPPQPVPHAQAQEDVRDPRGPRACPGRLRPAPEPALARPGARLRPPAPRGDGPVDLRKRPRPQEPVGPPRPAPVLSDYHKCTACSISFNSIENYLAHKAYYCPGTVAGDLVDHFRTAHGLVLTRLPCGPPPGSHSPGRSEAPPLRPAPPSSPAWTPPTELRPLVPLLNGSPASPRPLPSGCLARGRGHKGGGTEPAPEHARPCPRPRPHVPESGTGLPLPNGTSRFCRLCNIRFSSLSTFVAHKKYYCSSHSAEHVK